MKVVNSHIRITVQSGMILENQHEIMILYKTHHKTGKIIYYDGPTLEEATPHCPYRGVRRTPV